MGLKHRYRRRRRRARTGTLALLLLLTAAFLVSCVAGSNSLWIKGVLGLDAHAYAAEPTVTVMDSTGDTVAELTDMVEILAAGSIRLQGFRNTSQLLRHYRDAILNDMLRDHYSLYTGNGQALSAAEQGNPYFSLSTAIPAKDFENTVNRYFGGSATSHKDGDVFQYISRAQVYTAPVQTWECSVDVLVDRVEETLHTYRLYFRLTDGEELSGLYTGVFVKREDGSCYFRSLRGEE
ncbi:MAG: hypothetical protein IJX62_03800 [Clostridia bacterium]|nr:hypothetical protein [Clostridia bacterium]